MITRIRRWYSLTFDFHLCFQKSGVYHGMYKPGKVYPFYGGSKAVYLGRGWFKYVNS